MSGRLTPFQRDVLRMIDGLQVDLAYIGAADEALTRRIVRPDTGQLENDRVDNNTTSDPAGDEAVRRCEAMGNREDYRDAMLKIWAAIKALRLRTYDVLHNEPVVPHGGQVCATKDCTNFASPHTRPDTGDQIADLCDDCWKLICTWCYTRPKADYRHACEACYRRELRKLGVA